MKHIFLVVIGLSLLACGGGPKRLSRKGYCFNSVDQYGDFVKYDPIPLMIDNPSYKFAEFKTSEETPDDSRAVTLEDGEYVFVVAEIFYEKFDPAIKAKNKYVRMHLQRLRKPSLSKNEHDDPGNDCNDESGGDARPVSSTPHQDGKGTGLLVIHEHTGQDELTPGVHEIDDDDENDAISPHWQHDPGQNTQR